MARFLLLLLTLFCATPARDVLTLSVGDAECVQACPDDDASGACAPDCQDCTCCSHVRTLAVAPPPGVLWSEAHALAVDTPVKALVSADSGDILHVPRPALA